MAVVLIIDDDPVITQTTRMLLAREGYAALTAGNGNRGLKLCREHEVDVVLTDIIMPEKEGLETIRDLRREFPCIKIIAMSGGGRIDSQDYLELAGKLGAHRTLVKPFRKQALLNVLEEVLKI